MAVVMAVDVSHVVDHPSAHHMKPVSRRRRRRHPRPVPHHHVDLPHSKDGRGGNLVRSRRGAKYARQSHFKIGYSVIMFADIYRSFFWCFNCFESTADAAVAPSRCGGGCIGETSADAVR